MLLSLIDTMADNIKSSTGSDIDVGTLYDSSELALVVRTGGIGDEDLALGEELKPVIQILSQNKSQMKAISTLEDISRSLKALNGMSLDKYRITRIRTQNLPTYVEKTSRDEWIYSTQYEVQVQQTDY